MSSNPRGCVMAMFVGICLVIYLAVSVLSYALMGVQGLIGAQIGFVLAWLAVGILMFMWAKIGGE